MRPSLQFCCLPCAYKHLWTLRCTVHSVTGLRTVMSHTDRCQASSQDSGRARLRSNGSKPSRHPCSLYVGLPLTLSSMQVKCIGGFASIQAAPMQPASCDSILDFVQLARQAHRQLCQHPAALPASRQHLCRLPAATAHLTLSSMQVKRIGGFASIQAAPQGLAEGTPVRPTVPELTYGNLENKYGRGSLVDSYMASLAATIAANKVCAVDSWCATA